MRADAVERMERAARLTRQGYTATEIAEDLGVTTRSVQRYRREAGISRPPHAFRWTPEADETARRMLDSGSTRAAVARAIGAAHATVSRRYPRGARA